MNNPSILKSVSGVAFIISALFSIILMTSGVNGFVAVTLATFMVLILELCKCGFFYESLTNKSLHLPIRILLGTIALLLVGYSIFASAGYVNNQANTTKNKQTKESSQYKQLEQGKSLQQDLYAVKKSEIEDLKKLKQQQQANGDSIVASMPKDYRDRKNEARADTAAQIAKTQELINQRSSELTSINASLLSPISIEGLKVNNDAGYAAMFKTIAGWLGNKTNPESLELWFYITLGIIFEITAVLTAYLAQLKKDPITHRPSGNNPEKQEKPKIDYKPSAVGERVIQSGRLKGLKFKFKPRPNNVSEFKPRLIETARPKHETKPNEVSANSRVEEGDIQKYITYIMENRTKNNLAPGRNKIVQGTGLTQEKCRTIHNILIERGYIETGDKCTKIIKGGCN